MHQSKFTKLRNKKMLIFFSVIFLFLFIGMVYFYSSAEAEKKQGNLSKLRFENKQENLAAISEYIQKLDLTIIEKQPLLLEILQSEMTENLSKLYENLDIIEKHLSQLDVSSSIQNQTSEEIYISISDSLIILSETEKAILDSILSSKETITGILSSIQSEQNNQYSSVIEKIDNLTASLSYAETKLKAYHKTLVELGSSIQHNISENQTELLAFVDNMQKDIERLLNDCVLQFDTNFQKSFLALSEKLASIHQQLVDTDDSIHFILTDLQTAAEINHTEILNLFLNLQSNIEIISYDINEAHHQIQNLLFTLSEDTASNHNETLKTLNSLKSNLQDFSQSYFSKIIVSISDMQKSIDSSFSTVKTELSDTIISLDTELSKTLSKYHTGTANQLTSIQNSVDNQYSSFTNILNSNNNELRKYLENTMKTINQNLEQVFTYVSSGKSNLASALLTKGVSCDQDATFAEIRQAILDIPQKIVVGTAELPGEISYEYHYHTDSNNNMPHTEFHSSNGGCYTSPIFHTHIGDSILGGGCYGTPVNHTHTSSCYSITKTERKITGYWFTGEGTGHGCCTSSHGQNWARFSYTDNIYKNGKLISSISGNGELGYCCGLCVSDKAASKGYSSTNSSIICGYSDGLNGYTLNCGMTNNTIISYKPSCGFIDGQITGAHILYQNISK